MKLTARYLPPDGVQQCPNGQWLALDVVLSSWHSVKPPAGPATLAPPQAHRSGIGRGRRLHAANPASPALSLDEWAVINLRPASPGRSGWAACQSRAAARGAQEVLAAL
jgi:hypothetical protein